MNQDHPTEFIRRLRDEAGKETDPNKRELMLESAEQIKYMLTLLELSAHYIQDHIEDGIDPRFMRAIKAIFPDINW